MNVDHGDEPARDRRRDRSDEEALRSKEAWRVRLVVLAFLCAVGSFSAVMMAADRNAAEKAAAEAGRNLKNAHQIAHFTAEMLLDTERELVEQAIGDAEGSVLRISLNGPDTDLLAAAWRESIILGPDYIMTPEVADWQIVISKPALSDGLSASLISLPGDREISPRVAEKFAGDALSAGAVATGIGRDGHCRRTRYPDNLSHVGASVPGMIVSHLRYPSRKPPQS